MTGLEFGVTGHAVPGSREFTQLVCRADALGYDVFAAPDHLGALSPFAALTAAGMVSPRLRLRTYVLNAGFWNAALLAREVATVDLLSGGRAELGLGAGHMKAEHDDAGLPWPALAQRVQALERLLVEVRRRLADEGHRPRPVQPRVPVLVGAMSAPGLAVAAHHADVVGFAGLRQVPGAEPGTFTLSSSTETAERVEQVRARAAGRAYRSDVLLQAVVLGADPAASAAVVAASAPGLTVAQLLDSPFVLLARDAAEAAEELRRRRERFGFDSVTTHQPYLEALGEVIRAYRGAGGR